MISTNALNLNRPIGYVQVPCGSVRGPVSQEPGDTYQPSNSQESQPFSFKQALSLMHNGSRPGGRQAEINEMNVKARDATRAESRAEAKARSKSETQALRQQEAEERAEAGEPELDSFYESMMGHRDDLD